MHSNIILIIFKEIYSVHRLDSNWYYRMTTLTKSSSGSNGNEELVHSLQISRTGASPLDAV